MVERQDQGLGRAVATAGFGGLGGISRARCLGLLAGLAALLDSLKVRAGQDRQGGAQHQRAGEGVDQLVHDDSFGMRNRGLELREGNKVP